jgi:hypothetical protein
MGSGFDIHPMRPEDLALPLVAVLLGACASGAPAPALEVRELESPAGQGSGEPFLSAAGDIVYLSWLQASGPGAHDLRFARYEEGRWGVGVSIASGDRFFVNWADFPSVVPAPDGSLWAHWLERGEPGGRDYGIRLVRSDDDGATWSTPWTPHDDATATEHGFVTSAPVPGALGFVWLDGRRYAAGPGGGAPTEETALYFRAMGVGGAAGPETLLDARVCDCCQTDAALTDEGPVVVYRDRSPDEVRDIFITRLVAGQWSEGRPVHADGWETGACPVNGPAVAARGSAVAVAWFTAAGGVPRVKVSFSRDAGSRFGDPVSIDGGDPVGRVDLLMRDDGTVLVSWLERTVADGAEVLVRHVAQDGRIGEPSSVSASSSRRAGGVPRIVAAPGGGALVAWTDLAGVTPRVRVTAVEVKPR